MKVHSLMKVAALICVLSLFASPQNQEKAPAATAKPKLQIFFSELETQWLKAAQNKDQAAINGIVAEDFEVWTSAAHGSPMSRADWLLEVFGRRLLSFQIKQLAVRDLSPEIAVVSFVETATYQQSATPQTEDRFIVDIWINYRGGDNWRCTDRYVSRVDAIPSGK
jgi:Domain of unknown function (DUF4440)